MTAATHLVPRMEVAAGMTADQGPTQGRHTAAARSPVVGRDVAAGAAIHPRFLRLGPWALSAVVAGLFGLSFATSYAALYDYARELEFPREFAVAFPLVLDAVIVVLAVTLLLERALGRRTMTVKGWQIALRLPSWPLLALWGYFAGSVAGNVGHAPPILAAQLVAAVPPVSAALTFHLLLRLLDRAPALRAVAETYEERSVAERERAAVRRARRDRIKSGRPGPTHAISMDEAPSRGRLGQPERGNGHRELRALPGRRALASGFGTPTRHRQPSASAGASAAAGQPRPARPDRAAAELDVLRRRVRAAIDAGDRVTGATVGRWLGVSARTGRRRLSALLDQDPELAESIAGRAPD